MAQTALELVNLALATIGADTISSLTEDTKEATLASLLYSQARDEVLEAHPWVCALKRAELDMDTPADYGWENAFALPEDFLSLVEVEGAGADSPRVYEIEGKRILTDLDTMRIRYVARVEDVSLFPPAMTDCIVLNLASKLAYAIVGKESLAANLYQRYRFRLTEARCAEARTAQNEPEAEDTLLWERS